MSLAACRGRAGQAAGSMGRRSGPRRSALFRDESSAARRERPARARKRRSWPWPCRWRGTPATCARPSRAVVLLRSSGSPHGQASAIAAQRASLKREIACLRLQLGKEKSITETALGSNRTLDSDSRKWDSQLATDEKGFRDFVSGAFFFLRWCSLTW